METARTHVGVEDALAGERGDMNHRQAELRPTAVGDAEAVAFEDVAVARRRAWRRSDSDGSSGGGSGSRFGCLVAAAACDAAAVAATAVATAANAAAAHTSVTAELHQRADAAAADRLSTR